MNLVGNSIHLQEEVVVGILAAAEEAGWRLLEEKQNGMHKVDQAVLEISSVSEGRGSPFPCFRCYD